MSSVASCSDRPSGRSHLASTDALIRSSAGRPSPGIAASEFPLIDKRTTAVVGETPFAH
jgi:hypothetical protein